MLGRCWLKAPPASATPKAGVELARPSHSARGAPIAQQLASFGVIDEYHLLVHPPIMGKGKPLFKNRARPFQLKLIGTEDFGNGVML